jgi:hypothetical protein|tara:strand:- start:565 stop:786 length:222 start_codon:yes stop_codon:yes gene_type:complete
MSSNPPIPKRRPISRGTAFLKHTEKLVDLYPKSTTSKVTGNPTYSEKRRKKLNKSINANMQEAAIEAFGDLVK